MKKKYLKYFEISLIVFFISFSYAQELKMVGRQERHSSYDWLQEVGGTIYLEEKTLPASRKSRIVIRLCSREPLELAIAKSALFIPGLIEYFELLGYRDHLSLIKSTDCLSESQTIVPVEIWTIPDGKDLPLFVEKVDALALHERVWSSPLCRFIGSIRYLTDANEFAKQLKNDKTRKGVILVTYFRNTRDTRSSIKKIRSILLAKGINLTRITIQIRKFEPNVTCTEPLRTTVTRPAFYLINFE